jgi:hypothetical protein
MRFAPGKQFAIIGFDQGGETGLGAPAINMKSMRADCPEEIQWRDYI